MKNAIAAASILALGASGALAGGIDRSGQSIAVIFEPGTYVELSFGQVMPSVSGVGTVFSGTPGADSGNMTADYTQLGLAYKTELTDGLDMALIFDQPFGADVSYPASAYFATGSVADLDTSAITALLNYRTASNFSVHGGLRVQSFSAEATVFPLLLGYTVSGAMDQGFGYLIGVAFEKPEIALRVALTYNSAIEHSLATTETSDALGGPNASTTVINTPQSVNLEFKTGIAADTLLFGSVRWVEWSAFDITPADYFVLTSGGSLVSYDDDRISYSLGIGRRLNDTWSVAATAGFEKTLGGFSSNLGPTDGNKNIGVGATYTRGNMKITGGVRYVKIGDAQTTLDDVNAASDFTGNSAIGFGIKVAFSL